MTLPDNAWVGDCVKPDPADQVQVVSVPTGSSLANMKTVHITHGILLWGKPAVALQETTKDLFGLNGWLADDMSWLQRWLAKAYIWDPADKQAVIDAVLKIASRYRQ